MKHTQVYPGRLGLLVGELLAKQSEQNKEARIPSDQGLEFDDSENDSDDSALADLVGHDL